MLLRNMHGKLVQLIIDRPNVGLATSGGVTAAGVISLVEAATKIGGFLIVLVGLIAAWYNLKVQRHAAKKLEEQVKTKEPASIE
jgi:hypothetical protein